jgi:hypothetical protein
MAQPPAYLESEIQFVFTEKKKEPKPARALKLSNQFSMPHEHKSSRSPANGLGPTPAVGKSAR